MTIISLILTALGILFFSLYTGSIKNFNWYGSILALLTLLPHELLHAICFKEDVFLYTNFKKGMLFVTGTENMTKNRFIFMNLLPNIIFGWIPFLIFLLKRDLYLIGSMSAFTIAMGAGDYYNVYIIMKQMPRKAYLYSMGFSTYWFVTDK